MTKKNLENVQRIAVNIGAAGGWFVERDLLPDGWIPWAALAGALVLVNLIFWAALRSKRAREQRRNAATPQ